MSSPAQLDNAWLDTVQYRDRDEWSSEPLWFGIDDKFEVLDLQLDEEDNSYNVRGQLTLGISWFIDEEQTMEAVEAPFDLTLTIGADFIFQPGREERFVRAWLNYNAAYLLWPYARAYTATITSLGRMPRLMLPTSQVPELPDLESEEDVRSSLPAVEQAPRPEGHG
jgi:hypothetical protein